MEGNPVTYLDPFGMERRIASETRRDSLNEMGKGFTRFSIANLVIGGAAIGLTGGAATPVVLSIGTFLTVSSVAVGVATEYEWDYAYASGWENYEDTVKNVNTAAIGGSLSLFGHGMGVKLATGTTKLFVKTIGMNGKEEVIQLLVDVIEKGCEHLSDVWSLINWE